jgi:protocatechuate 3,4-dioxygenase beta subunit
MCVDVMRRAVLLSAIVIAATRGSFAQPPVPGPPAGGSQPRDQRPVSAQAGTAIVRGRVVAADTGRPLRRARITLNAPELGRDGRTTSTNLDGRYEITELPAARYTIRVTRSGFLPLQYGQRRPLEQGKPLQVHDKQLLDRIDFALPRSSVISGRITDELSDPVAEVQVFAMRLAYFQGRRRLIPASSPTRTDDAGEYRLVGLVPGAYYVMAQLRETWTVTENGVEDMMGYATTYYPGAGALADARRIMVGVGQETSNTNFPLMPGRAASVSGTAFDSLGRPLGGRNVAMVQLVFGPTGGSFMLGGSASSAADGTFTIKNIPPGQYKLQVQAVADPFAPRGAQEVASIAVSLDGADLKDLVLTTSVGWTMSGHMSADGAMPPDTLRDRFRVAARPVDQDSSPGPPPPPPPPGGGGPGIPDSGRVKDDWTFSASGVHGAARLRVAVADGWSVKAILHDGRDITDAPVEKKSGEELTGVEVIVTSRVTTVSGQLVDGKGIPLTDGTVIVFADDSTKWFEESRWIRAVRPDQQGQYQIKGLPPGDYLAVAVDYVEDAIWNDAEYLESIRRYGQKVTLNESAAITLSLKLVTPE